MSHTNPTALRVGMIGNLVGKRYRVAGRIVLGMEEEGETYYWNEFHLTSMEGESATLVFEETERGSEWRVFTLFQPRSPLTVPEAAARRVGDIVNLEGRTIPVTLVDESRVYHIEGEAPEGVKVGDIAHYFNAGADNQMIVVSWTGDEIEFYRGVNLPHGAVASAFGLQSEMPNASLGSSASTIARPGNWVAIIVAVVFGTVVLFAVLASCRPTRSRASAVKTSAPPSPLTVGSTGALNGKTYRVRAHSITEVAQVNLIFDQHEYDLADRDGNEALLVYGSKPGLKDWLLFMPMQLTTPLTPPQAAAKRTGEVVSFDGLIAPVSEIFRSTIRPTEILEKPASQSNNVLYGLAARSGSTRLLARWNEKSIAFYKGTNLPAKEVTAAFGLKK